MGDIDDMLAATRKEAFHPISPFGTTPEVARLLFQRIDALERQNADLQASNNAYLARARAAEAIADLPLNLRRCAAKIERDLRQEVADRAAIRAMVAGSIPQMVAFWANPERFGVMLRVAAERAASAI
jgi:hypothetical protein